jgi:phospho-N-acetylmuramoyl-pentapeptide-transferase
MDTLALIKVLSLAAISFVVAIAWTPALTHFLYKYKLGKQIRDDGSTPIFSKLHAHKSGTPTMGGVLIWGTTLVLAVIFAYVWLLAPESFFGNLNFLTREQRVLPLGALR